MASQSTITISDVSNETFLIQKLTYESEFILQIEVTSYYATATTDNNVGYIIEQHRKTPKRDWLEESKVVKKALGTIKPIDAFEPDYINVFHTSDLWRNDIINVFTGQICGKIEKWTNIDYSSYFSKKDGSQSIKTNSNIDNFSFDKPKFSGRIKRLLLVDDCLDQGTTVKVFLDQLVAQELIDKNTQVRLYVIYNNKKQSRAFKGIDYSKIMEFKDNVTLLEKTKSSILLIEERRNKSIVVAAPHHAPSGVKRLPCEEHEDSDENSGTLAHLLAEANQYCSVIACNYTIDSNKSMSSDYSKQIVAWSPKFLIEIHGHGAKAISASTIEISSGSVAKNEWSKRFAQALQNNLNSNPDLKNFIVIGDFLQLHFKATNSQTIQSNAWTPFHIELPPSLRIGPDGKLPERFSNAFIIALTTTINEVCIS